MDSRKRRLIELRERYDDGLRRFGDNFAGLFYPNEADRLTRFDVMLDLIERENEHAPVVLCDFGCGTGDLLAHIRRRSMQNITYIGVDISPVALAIARKKFPGVSFLEMDVLDESADVTAISCDFLVATGVFTGKFDMSHDEMWALVASTIRRLWPQVRRGLAFNVMSTIVDWERSDLFHLSMDDAARLLHDLVGRNVTIRADYGLYEYTAYARREIAKSHSTVQYIPAMKPQIATTPSLLRYLPRIDKSRIYSNHGPLVLDLQNRITELLGLSPGILITAASGTAALSGAILASSGCASEERPFALLPAFTFAATALAAEACGYRPYFLDVDPSTWMLNPAEIKDWDNLERVGVVIVVCPFGRLINQDQWMKFQAETGIPVVVDAAASFDLLQRRPGHIVLPAALSFHATKTFATGEGGGVIAPDADFGRRVTQALNFGFHASRETRTAAINGKMSEYNAAVGLAELDGWPTKITALETVAGSYRRIAKKHGIGDELITTPLIGANYVLFHAHNGIEAQILHEALIEKSIDSRFWYGGGLHRHEHFFHASRRGQLVVTEQLATSLLGLPVAPDLTEEMISRIISCLANARGRRPK